jgi:hypothetical protein
MTLILTAEVYMKKIRVICNGVSFYTSRSAIKQRRVGDFSLQNDALSYALEQMGTNQGIGTTVRYYDHKMKQEVFNIQLSVV